MNKEQSNSQQTQQRTITTFKHSEEVSGLYRVHPGGNSHLDEYYLVSLAFVGRVEVKEFTELYDSLKDRTGKICSSIFNYHIHIAIENGTEINAMIGIPVESRDGEDSHLDESNLTEAFWEKILDLIQETRITISMKEKEAYGLLC